MPEVKNTYKSFGEHIVPQDLSMTAKYCTELGIDLP